MNLLKSPYRNGERLDLNGLAVRLAVNPRARRVSLRIDRAAREAVATAPSSRRLSEAVAFARERRTWIGARLAALPADRRLGFEPLAVFGATWRLIPDGRRPRLIAAAGGAPPRLTGCGAGEVDGQLVARAVKGEALATFRARAEVHCRALNVGAPSVSIMDPATRWGSCTAAGPKRAASIRLSWRLALAPFAVADYVVAHECAHLIEANHGPRFWAAVRALVGDPAPHRAWLRTHGARLHAYR